MPERRARCSIGRFAAFIHCSPRSAAGPELFLAARTDSQLPEAVQQFNVESTENMARIFKRAIDGAASTAAIRRLLITTMATMRGLLILSFVQDDGDAEWRITRRQLLATWRAALTLQP